MVASLVDLQINAERLHENFEQLSQIGATIEGGISRLALSNEDLEARAWFADQFEMVGLIVRDDDAGNLSGILPCQSKEAKTLLIGSHLDSVPNAGKFDCSVGILAALECMRTIHEAGIELPVHLEAMDFTDEEGNWQSLFGSRAIAGKLDTDFLHDKDADFGPFRAALYRAGIRPQDVFKAKRDPQTIAGYIQLHIEQGYRLHESGIDIGVVTGIVGRTTFKLKFYGEASHSGTTKMSKRRDALLGASAYVQAAHAKVREVFPEGVFNCGNMEVMPGIFNVIPAEAHLTMECRHADKAILTEMEAYLTQLADEIAVEYHLSLVTKRLFHMPAAVMSPAFVDIISDICQRQGISHAPLVSYAGHDAQVMGDFVPSGMIFIPSVDGISHSPKEFTEWDDVVQGTNVLLHTILAYAQRER